MPRIIAASELQHPDTVAVARWLVGKILVRTRRGARAEARITEAEAYHGQSDLACHASKGRTGRTDVLFGPGGFWYVYLCYGIHEMLNVVSGPEGFPAAVLIRGVEGISGPGRVTKALSINRRLNRLPAIPETGLHLEDDGFVPSRSDIIAGPRVGVEYAGPVWAMKPWRFLLRPGSGPGV